MMEQMDYFGEPPKEKQYLVQICDEVTSLRSGEVIQSGLFYEEWDGPASISLAWQFAKAKFNRDITTKNIRKISTVFRLYRRV